MKNGLKIDPITIGWVCCLETGIRMSQQQLMQLLFLVKTLILHGVICQH